MTSARLSKIVTHAGLKRATGRGATVTHESAHPIRRAWRGALLALTLFIGGCTWTIGGTVRDAQGQPLAGALVEVLVDQVVVKSARTDAKGRVRALTLTADTVPEVRVSRSGFPTRSAALEVYSVLDRLYFASFDLRLEAGPAGLVKYSGAPSESVPSEEGERQALALGLPSLDRSASVLGPDANGNGIRDDIEAWIASRNDRTAEQKAAMRQYAKALQAELAAERTPQGALAAVLVAERAHNCLELRASSFDDYLAVSRQLRDYTLNTIERVRANAAIDRLLSGQTWELASGDTCEVSQ